MLNSSPHSILVKQQIIKLRLNPGSSALDLNDPIVKSEILKKVSPEFKWFLFQPDRRPIKNKCLIKKQNKYI